MDLVAEFVGETLLVLAFALGFILIVYINSD